MIDTNFIKTYGFPEDGVDENCCFTFVTGDGDGHSICLDKSEYPKCDRITYHIKLAITSILKRNKLHK